MLAFAAPATDYYVDNKAGSDANDGLSPQSAFATLRTATPRLVAGDTLHIAPGRTYRETLQLSRSGTPSSPITVKGNGSILSGLRPVPDEGWIDKGDDLWFHPNSVCWGALRPRVFMGETNMVSLVCRHYSGVDPRKLPPETAIWNKEGIWFRTRDGASPVGYGLFGSYGGNHSGVMVMGGSYITVEDLTVEGFSNDGFNVHGSCHGLIFRNIVGRWNGDDGFSVHEDVQANVYNAYLHHNDNGIQDINLSQTFFFGCTVESNRLCGVDLYGGLRILHDVTVKENSGCQVRIQVGKSRGLENDDPMLRTRAYLKGVKVEGGEGEGLLIGRDAGVTAVGCSISGTDIGIRVDGSLTFIDGTVSDCRKQDIVQGKTGTLRQACGSPKKDRQARTVRDDAI